MISKRIAPVLMAGATTLISTQLSAAGFALIENSASGMGNSFAGGAAIADDASTVWFNPAGMTRLSNEMLIAAHIIMPTSDYSDDGSTQAAALGGGTLDPTNTDRDGAAGRNALVPNFYWVKEVNENLYLGFGFNAPFGLATEYEDDWIGRYHGVLSDTKTLNFNPSIAYKMGNVSLGFGISAQYIDVILTSAIDLGSVCTGTELAGGFPTGTCAAVGATPQNKDGFAELTADNWAYNFNIGVLFEISDDARVGFAYRSGVDHDVDGDADFTVPGDVAFLTGTGNFLDTTLTASVSLPAITSLSYFQSVNDQISIMADYTVTSWSDFEELRIDYEGAQADTVTTEDWEDSARISVGLNYQSSAKWLYRFGLAIDETPIPSAERRTPRIPGNDRTWISAGVTHTIDKDRSFSLGFAHLIIDDTEINNTYESASAPMLEHTLKGTYEASVSILSAQFRWQY